MLVPRTKQDLSGTLIQIFPFFSTFRLRHLDENGRNLYNYICICSPNMRRQGTYFTKTFEAQIHCRIAASLIELLYLLFLPMRSLYSTEHCF